MIDDVRELQVNNDEKTETWTLEVCARDGIFHPARSLSDGTLRFLVLTALAQDPQCKGLICLEEPENGIHPSRIPAMVQLLQDIAVDPQFAAGDDNPLRQVVINTHAPVVINWIAPENIIYLDNQVVLKEGSRGRVAAIHVPAESWRAKLQPKIPHITPGQLGPYLGPRHEIGEQMLSQSYRCG